MIESALTLSSEEPWECISLEDIAKHADIKIIDAFEYFDDKSDVLIAYGRQIDRQMKESVYFEHGSEMTTREKIFDALMERFDIVNQNRNSVLSILNSFKSDPKQLIVNLPHLAKSVYHQRLWRSSLPRSPCGRTAAQRTDPWPPSPAVGSSRPARPAALSTHAVGPGSASAGR